MRRATTWILILALILLALCVLWFLPRLLREPPRSLEGGVASAGAPEGNETLPRDVQAPEAKPSLPLPSTKPDGGSTEGKAGTEAVLDEEPHAATRGRIVGRLVDRAVDAVAGAAVLAAHAPDLGMPVEPRSWWIAHLPLDVADPAALGAEVPARAVSDAAGRFAFEAFEPGRTRLAVRSGNYAPLDKNDLLLAAGATLDLGDVVLEHGSQISGTVVDTDGRPVAGVPILRIDDFGGSLLPPLAPSVGAPLAVTGRGGVFRTLPVGPGPWTVLASGGAELADLALHGDDPGQGSNLLVTLAPAASIRGRLLSRSAASESLVVRAAPVDTADAPVPFDGRFDARQARVLRDGSFEIRGLDPNAYYELCASSSTRRWEDESAWSPPTLAPAGAERVAVAWDADASVTFSLIDARSRTSVAVCEALLEGAMPSRAELPAPTEEAHGLRVLEGVRPLRPLRRIRLTVASRGFRPVAQSLDLRPGSNLELGALAVDPIPTLSVHAIDARSGKPVADARVVASVMPDGSSGALDASDLPVRGIATDAKGVAQVFSFAGAGSRIEVRARGFAPACRLGPFGGGFSTASLEFRLVRGATAHVRVIDAGGEPVRGARVEHVEGDWSPNEAASERAPRPILERPDPERSSIADEKGGTVFVHLPPGRHAFRVQRWRGFLDGEWTLRELGDGEDVEIALVSQAWASLGVRVVDGGVPLAGAPVALLRRQGIASPLDLLEAETPLPPGLDARLDSRGTCAIQSVDPGTYLLAFGVAGQRLRACREVVIKEGANQLEIDLARDVVGGRILRGDGSPVAGAQVFVITSERERALPSVSRGLGYTGFEDLIKLGVERLAAVADENGGFRLVGLPLEEECLIFARAGEHLAGRTRPFVLRRAGGGDSGDIALVRAGALEVHATMRASPCACGLAAYPRNHRAKPRFRRVIPGRPEVLVGLEPGLWDLVLGVDGGESREMREIEVVAGETRTVEVWLP